MDTTVAPLRSIDVDIGKEVLRLVGFGTNGKIAFRRKIKRLVLIKTSRSSQHVCSAWKPASVRTSSAVPCASSATSRASFRVRSKLVSRRTATINQIRAFLIEQGIAVCAGVTALRNSLFDILKNREDEISPRMNELIVGLYEDWLWLDERIETITKEIEEISQREGNCLRLMSVPGVGPLISTAVVAAIGTGEAFDRRRDFGAWLGLVLRQ